MYTKISDYGLIGNCRSCALVSKWGSVDWACFPDFDSESFLCKILDDKKGGFFDIHPVGYYQSSQFYKENTNILKTDFFNHSGRVLVTDFMPISKTQEENNSIPDEGLKIVRRVKAKIGNHKVRIEIKITPNYALETASAMPQEERLVFQSENKRLVLFCPDSKFEIKEKLGICEFELKEGQEVFFALGYYSKNEIDSFSKDSAKQLYKECLAFWLWWVGLSRYSGVFEKEVTRSSLVLKLLTFNPTGAVIAAPTTSLPEKIGGSFNWDYRYTWLRDASFTMYAFLGLGYLKEAQEFMNWLEKVCLPDHENIQIMYGLRGEKDLKEQLLPHLAGYENSKPVRIKNEAYNQKQLDVYGEVLTAINLYVSSGGEASSELKKLIVHLVGTCVRIWKEKDAGIWEPRNDYQHHTYSKLMCWVGLNRGIHLAEILDLEVDITNWQSAETDVKSDILKNGFDKELNSFVDTYAEKTIDASNLNIPLVGFLPASDERILSTLDITMSKLTNDWFVYRTSDETDKFKSGEGAFFLTTFWVIDTLSALGRVKEAKIWLEKIIHFSTPLGLYAEMFDPSSKEHLGNYPQAFTHLGLINSVLNLNKAIRYGAEKEAIIPAERLRQVARLVNQQVGEGLEMLIPSAIRNGLLVRERRRTRKHSLLGRLLHRN